jgi:hypothetical protein
VDAVDTATAKIEIVAVMIDMAAVTKEVAVVAVAVSIPVPVLAHSAVTKSRKLTTKTTICCDGTCTKMEKSVPVDNLAIARSTNVRSPFPSNGHVTWRYFPFQAKFYASSTFDYIGHRVKNILYALILYNSKGI